MQRCGTEDSMTDNEQKLRAVGFDEYAVLEAKAKCWDKYVAIRTHARSTITSAVAWSAYNKAAHELDAEEKNLFRIQTELFEAKKQAFEEELEPGRIERDAQAEKLNK